MAYRLGEALVKEGVISEEQLSETLTYQNRHGGRLGSNLVQLGYVSEDRLATLLGKMSLYPCVDKGDLQNIAPSVVAAIPAAIARKHDVIPFRRMGDLLSVALVSPQSEQIISEINVLTGCRVKAYIAPEIVIRKALDTCYPEERLAMPPSLSTETVVVHTEEEEIRYLRADAETIAPSAAGLGQVFLDAENATAVANLVMGYLKKLFSRVVLLKVEGDSASGWKTSGLGETMAQAFRMKLDLGQQSLFRSAVEKKVPFCGKPEDLSAEDRRFLEAIGGEKPLEILIYPVDGTTRPVLLVYVDNLGKPLGAAASDAKKVLEKASLALKILSAKSQLLAD